MTLTIFPSVMARNQKELDILLRKLRNVAPTLHLDIVHPDYAPNHSLDFPFKLSNKFRYRAHVMTRHPERWIYACKHNIDLFIPQLETMRSPADYIKRMQGKPIAMAMKPETKVREIKPYLPSLDYVLILTAHPGFYGARYLHTPLRKIPILKRLAPHLKIIVDGGINPETIKEAKKAGADYFISGSFVSKSENPRKALRQLDRALKEG